MPIFKYSARDHTGRKISNKFINSSSESSALVSLEKNNLNNIKLTNLDGTLELKILLLINPVSPKDLVVFSRQFSTMISASLPLVQSLKAVADQTINITLKIALFRIADDIDDGATFSVALSKQPKIFSGFFINVVKSGEKSGKLNEVLNYLADEMERNYEIGNKLKGAMIYPAFVMIVLGGVGAIMMIFVIPKLMDVIIKAGGKLPLPTRIIIGTSNFLVSFWWLVIVLLIVLFFLFKFIVSTKSGRYYFDLFKFKIPIFGKMFSYKYIIYFSSSMYTLLAGGVQISDSLKIVSKIVDNQIYKNLLIEASSKVSEGEAVSDVFRQSQEIPSMVSQMMAIGEKTGKLDTILKRINEFYSRELFDLLDNLVTLLEPLIIVILGIAVAIMVAAIILPMYNMAV